MERLKAKIFWRRETPLEKKNLADDKKKSGWQTVRLGKSIHQFVQTRPVRKLVIQPHCFGFYTPYFNISMVLVAQERQWKEVNAE